MSTTLRYALLCVPLSIAVLAGPLPAAQVILDLGSASMTAQRADIDVVMRFAGSPGDSLEAVALSIHGSTLNDGQLPFPTARFEPDLTTFAGWDALGDSLESDGVETLLVFSQAARSLLPADIPYRLGTIKLDLSSLPQGAVVTLSIAGGSLDDATNTDVGGIVGGLEIFSFAEDEGPDDSALLSFGPRNPVTMVVPEPAPWVISAPLLLIFGRYRRRTMLR